MPAILSQDVTKIENPQVKAEARLRNAEIARMAIQATFRHEKALAEISRARWEKDNGALTLKGIGLEQLANLAPGNELAVESGNKRSAYELGGVTLFESEGFYRDHLGVADMNFDHEGNLLTLKIREQMVKLHLQVRPTRAPTQVTNLKGEVTTVNHEKEAREFTRASRIAIGATMVLPEDLLTKVKEQGLFVAGSDVSSAVLLLPTEKLRQLDLAEKLGVKPTDGQSELFIINQDIDRVVDKVSPVALKLEFNTWADGGAEVDQREVFGLKGGNDSVNVLD